MEIGCSGEIYSCARRRAAVCIQLPLGRVPRVPVGPDPPCRPGVAQLDGFPVRWVVSGWDTTGGDTLPRASIHQGKGRTYTGAAFLSLPPSSIDMLQLAHALYTRVSAFEGRAAVGLPRPSLSQ